ncbi:MAG: ATP-binding cassette domain-containing protein [Nannocystaceae bacterium]
MARALELAAAAARRPCSARAAWGAVSRHQCTPDNWEDVAAWAAEAVGLRAQPLEGAPVGLARGEAALARARDGAWLVAEGGGRVVLKVVRLGARGEARERLSVRGWEEAASDRRYLHLRPALALAPIGVADQPAMKDRPWRRLREFVALERRDLWVVVAYALFTGGLALAVPVAVQALVNTVAFGSVLQPLVVLSVLLFGGLVFAGVLSTLQAYVVEVVQRRVFVRIAEDFGRRLPALRLDALDRLHAPELVHRFFDVLTIQKSIAVLLLDGLALSLQTAIGMLLLGFYHPLLLAFDALLVALLLVVLATGRGAIASARRESSAKYETAAWLENLTHVTSTLRGASLERRAASRTEAHCRDYLAARKAHFRVLLRQIAGGFGLQILSLVTLLGVGGWLVMARQLTLGQLVAAELVIAAMGAGFVKLGKNLEKLYDLNVGVLKIGSVVDLPIERRGGEPLRAAGPAAIALRDVVVTRGARTIVANATVEIAARERVLLRGVAGSGKSTLLEVIAGLRRCAGGVVTVDALDLRRADLCTLRDQIVLVRGVAFVTGTVMENVQLTSTEPLREPAVRRLLQLVGLAEVVDRLEHGLETELSPSGAPLSESEARRLVLARALAAKPRALLLDRALDHLGLGARAHAAVVDAVFNLAATVVVVTEDPAIAARCDRALTLDHGALEVG